MKRGWILKLSKFSILISLTFFNALTATKAEEPRHNNVARYIGYMCINNHEVDNKGLNDQSETLKSRITAATKARAAAICSYLGSEKQPKFINFDPGATNSFRCLDSKNNPIEIPSYFANWSNHGQSCD